MALFNRGDAYEAVGEHDRAIQDLNKVLKASPSHAAALAIRN